MSSEKTTISIKIDKETLEKSEILFSKLGMDLSTAINIFVKQSLREMKIPFTISYASQNSVNIQDIYDSKKDSLSKATDSDTPILFDDDDEVIV